MRSSASKVRVRTHQKPPEPTRVYQTAPEPARTQGAQWVDREPSEEPEGMPKGPGSLEIETLLSLQIRRVCIKEILGILGRGSFTFFLPYLSF